MAITAPEQSVVPVKWRFHGNNNSENAGANRSGVCCGSLLKTLAQGSLRNCTESTDWPKGLLKNNIYTSLWFQAVVPLAMEGVGSQVKGLHFRISHLDALGIFLLVQGCLDT